jgi:hypothetical protein
VGGIEFMPIDKINHDALKSLHAKYGDQIDHYEYEVWKESYLAPPPPKSFCQGMTRYRKAYRVKYVVLKDGTKVWVNQSDFNVGCVVIVILLIVLGLIFSLM